MDGRNGLPANSPRSGLRYNERPFRLVPRDEGRRMKDELISTFHPSSFILHPLKLRAAAAFLFWACVFAAVYCQAPLYYSNQNQYFLHGLADAGVGFLGDDWLANTKDPTPVFSLLVAATMRSLTPAA